MDRQRHHTEVPDVESLRQILATLVEWLYAISDTCMDLADAAKAAAQPQVESPDVVASRADSDASTRATTPTS